MNIVENVYEKELNDFAIRVKQGDLTEENVDAIIVPEFYKKSERAGLAKAVINKNGNAKAFDDFDKVAKEKMLAPAENVITDSYSYKYKKIIHTITVCPKGYSSEIPMVRAAIYNAIMAGYKLGLRSFSLPALNTGNGGSLSNYDSANSIILGFGDATEKIEVKENEKPSVSIVLTNNEMFEDFKEELSHYKQLGTGKGKFIHDDRINRFNDDFLGVSPFSVTSGMYNSHIKEIKNSMQK
ncbi:MAG: macro domain-containing protein [Alphaproteobacteria bacterium]|nr:macro domain-containing protein [Alphaproteobacteria bacterium]